MSRIQKKREIGLALSLCKKAADVSKQESRTAPSLRGKRAQRARAVFSDRCVSIARVATRVGVKSRRRFVGVGFCPGRFPGRPVSRSFENVAFVLKSLSLSPRSLEARGRQNAMASDDAETREAQEAEEDLRIFETLCISSPQKVNRWQSTHLHLLTCRSHIMHAHFTKAHTHALLLRTHTSLVARV